MLKFSIRTLSLTILMSAIVLTTVIIVFMMAVVLAGEGPVVRGISCQLGLSEGCLRQELQEERNQLKLLRRKNEELLAENQEAEALIQRLSDLDHASSSYVVFYTSTRRGVNLDTGHTYASLLDPDTLIGAHCYVHAQVRGAGTRRIDLGTMSPRKRLTLNRYSSAALRGTGFGTSDIADLQALCQWPPGAA